MTTTFVAGLAGLGTAVGLLFVLVGFRGSQLIRRPRSVPPWRVDRAWGLRLALALGAGLLAGVATGWLVGGALAAGAVWFLPRLVGPDLVHVRRVARIEAGPSWAEMLGARPPAGAGLEPAILPPAPLAPAAIRDEVAGLASRLQNGHRLAPALRLLAEELADPTADLVIASLVLAAEHQARQLGELLGS